jgi:hypothetical protein
VWIPSVMAVEEKRIKAVLTEQYRQEEKEAEKQRQLQLITTMHY